MIHSFLLIGQSNAAGRGYIEEAVKMSTAHIFVLRNGRWQPMYRPVNNDRSFSGVCFAESFAEKYAEKYKVEVGIIPCADGGTILEQWQPGEILFDNAVNQAKLAQRTSVIKGILWHQGEGDCVLNLAKTYKGRFETIMNAFRKELGLEDVPFLLGGLGDYLADCPLSEDLKNYKIVNEELKKVAETNEMTAFVPADGLTSNEDFLHFNAASLYEFGHRYFEEYEKFNIEADDNVIDFGEESLKRREMEKL